MAIRDDDIERLKATVSLVDVVGEVVSLRKVGRNFVGLCPFHAEKTPSFNVREEVGRYRCFGCDQSGDAITFVERTRHVDFVGAVEYLAAKVGMQLEYTTSGQSAERQRRKRLVEAMASAVEWYHERLLNDPAARPAREYLRSRGLHGEIARQFKLGWAPDDWDALAKQSGIDNELLRITGLAFANRTGRMQDAFRARVLFPIFSDTGDAVAIGGRVLPGSNDPAKYKNSPETPIYSKSRTLYGLNWAKSDVTNHDQVVVCEGYTDVIGFHRAGVPRAVATCGTAFTEDHVRLLKRYASRVVLAFDADAAGQGAAERFYEWEQKYQIQVAVARLPDGVDPGELAQRDPAALAAAVDDPAPFLAFRLRRVVDRRPARTPEERARARPSGDGRRERASRRQCAHAVRRRGRCPDRLGRRRPCGCGQTAPRRPGGGDVPTSPAAAGERRVRGSHTPRPELGRDRRLAHRGTVSGRRPSPGVPRPGRRRR